MFAFYYGNKNKKIFMRAIGESYRSRERRQQGHNIRGSVYPLLLVGMVNKKELLRHSIYIYTPIQLCKTKERYEIYNHVWREI